MSYFPENVLVEILTYVDGLPTWTNISASVESDIKVNTGFSDAGPLNRLAPGGDMRFDLANRDSAFDPSSTFYKAQKIRLRVKYGSLVKTKFFGYIDHIGLDVGTWGNQRAHVVAIDWLALAAKTPVRALEGMTNTTIDLAAAALLAQMQIQPEATDFESGDITLPSVFDQVTPNSTVYSELQNLVMGEWGYIYMRDGGQTLKVENSLSRIGDGSDYKTTNYFLNDGVAEDFLLEDGTNFLLEDGTNFLLEGEPTAASFNSDFDEEYTNVAINHGDNLTNKISASAIPVVIGGSTLVLYPFDIATGSKAILVSPNTAQSPQVIQGQYKDPTAGGTQISGTSMITPVVTTDWKFNSLATGLGTDLSANLTITWTLGQSGFKAVIVNSGPAGYITKFNVRGTPVYRYAPVETVIQDQQSIWDYGDYSLQFTRQYGQSYDDIQPFIFRLLMRDRKPRTIIGNPKFNAWDEQAHLAGFLALDIGDQIRLASTKPASDNLYYIQGVKFTITKGSEAIRYDYVTAETLAGAIEGVTEIAIEQTVTGQGVNFGYLPVISDLQYKTICARVYIANLDSKRVLSWGIDPGSQASFTIAKTTLIGVDYLTLHYTQPYSGGGFAAQSRDTALSAPLNQWINILVTYNNLAGLADFYLNNVLLTPSAGTTSGSGTRLSEAGAPVVCGAVLVPGSGPPGPVFLGKYQNIAVYNRVLSAAEISAIHNGGTRLPFASYPTDGLKFFFGAMDDDSYAAKLDGALGVSDTLYDLVNGFTGQPIGGPTLRAVG